MFLNHKLQRFWYFWPFNPAFRFSACIICYQNTYMYTYMLLKVLMALQQNNIFLGWPYEYNSYGCPIIWLSHASTSTCAPVINHFVKCQGHLCIIASWSIKETKTSAMRLNKVHSFVMCAGYLYLLPLFKAYKYQEAGLPLLYTLDINIVVEYYAPSLIHCSIGCISKGCLAFLFKLDGKISILFQTSV